MIHITSKKPFIRRSPHGRKVIMSQEDFLDELYPSAHKIHSTDYYPNIIREERIEIEDDKGNPTGKFKTVYYEERLPRYAFAFQRVIATKQIVHLCGNDVQFDLLNKDDKGGREHLQEFKKGWSEKDMELAFYKLVNSVKTTGDGAIVGFIDSEGVFSWRSLSYRDGDSLYAHYDRYGKCVLFVRRFSSYNESGEPTQLAEVWNEREYHLLEESDSSDDEALPFVFNCGGVPISAEGYVLIHKVKHGFSFVPVSYKRDDDGPAWSMSQDSCDGYELTFSQMSHSNQELGTPILWFKGDNHECVPDLNGTIKTISMGRDDDAGYLKAQSVADSFEKQLAITYRMIYEQSFTVIPPELRSGDLPAAALKILYSPAYEKSFTDCNEYQGALSDLVKIFTEGYGIEKKKTIEFSNVPLRWWLKPYVHINWSTTIADLAMAVQNGFVSRETASERISEYSTPNEWMRVQQEAQELVEQEMRKIIASKQNKSQGVSDGEHGG